MARDKDGVYRCRRGPHGVGKVLGRNKWVHRSVLPLLSEEEQTLVDKALDILGIYLPPPDIDIIVKINVSEGLVTFTHSADWKTATEPICGDMVGVKDLYSDRPVIFHRKQKGIPNIYHHKWMFVDDDYLGFSVKEAMKWSETWENYPLVKALLADPNEHFRLKIGRQDYWQEKVLDLIGVSPTYEEFINRTYIDRGQSAQNNVVPNICPYSQRKPIRFWILVQVFMAVTRYGFASRGLTLLLMIVGLMFNQVSTTPKRLAGNMTLCLHQTC